MESCATNQHESVERVPTTMPKAERKRISLEKLKSKSKAKKDDNDKEKSPSDTLPSIANLPKLTTTTAQEELSAATPPKDDPDANEARMSRGQRKRQAKREKYLRKERMIMSSLRVERAKEQSKRIDGLDSMKEALLNTISPSAKECVPEKIVAPSLLKSNRGRKNLVEKEVEQMNLVLQHPGFQANPLDTIREHLQNSIKPPPEPTSAKEPVEKAKRKRKKSRYRATRTKSRR